MKHSLNKKDRLKSYAAIRELFDHGLKLKHQPIALFYMIGEGKFEDGTSMKMGVAVGAKHFRKSVQRNLIKRRIREAYRLQRGALWEQIINMPLKISLFFVYADHLECSYDKISYAVKMLLDKCQAAIVEQKRETNQGND